MNCVDTKSTAYFEHMNTNKNSIFFKGSKQIAYPQ